MTAKTITEKSPVIWHTSGKAPLRIEVLAIIKYSSRCGFKCITDKMYVRTITAYGNHDCKRDKFGFAVNRDYSVLAWAEIPATEISAEIGEITNLINE